MSNTTSHRQMADKTHLIYANPYGDPDNPGEGRLLTLHPQNDQPGLPRFMVTLGADAVAKQVYASVSLLKFNPTAQALGFDYTDSLCLPVATFTAPADDCQHLARQAYTMVKTLRLTGMDAIPLNVFRSNKTREIRAIVWGVSVWQENGFILPGFCVTSANGPGPEILYSDLNYTDAKYAAQEFMKNLAD